MRKPLLIYNLLITSFFTVAGLASIKTGGKATIPLLFIPLVLYFLRQFKTTKATSTSSVGSADLRTSSTTTHAAKSTTNHPPQVSSSKTRAIPLNGTTSHDPDILDPEILSDKQISDINRRLFLKLIGSAGLATFTFSLFTKRAHGAFFGSVPGPGTVAIKDSSGTPIDPAEKEPTDGYEVNDVDDSTIPAYYGFVDKDGNWYITREGSSGDYRYVRGSSDYSTNWTNRTSQSYDYFNSVF